MDTFWNRSLRPATTSVPDVWDRSRDVLTATPRITVSHAPKGITVAPELTFVCLAQESTAVRGVRMELLANRVDRGFS